MFPAEAVCIITVIWKLFNRKYFIDNKVQGKIFSWIRDFSKYFYLEYISLAIFHATIVECSTAVKTINTYYTIVTYFIPYVIFLTIPFMQCEV